MSFHHVSWRGLSAHNVLALELWGRVDGYEMGYGDKPQGVNFEDYAIRVRHSDSTGYEVAAFGDYQEALEGAKAKAQEMGIVLMDNTVDFCGELPSLWLPVA